MQLRDALVEDADPLAPLINAAYLRHRNTEVGTLPSPDDERTSGSCHFVVMRKSLTGVHVAVPAGEAAIP